MQQRFRKLNDVMGRVERAKSAAAAFRLAAETGAPARGSLCWPDLIQVLETILPSGDEMDEAVDALRDCAECP